MALRGRHPSARQLLPTISGRDGGAAAGLDGVANFRSKGGSLVKQVPNVLRVENHHPQVCGRDDGNVRGWSTGGPMVAKAFPWTDGADLHILAILVSRVKQRFPCQHKREPLEPAAMPLDRFTLGIVDNRWLPVW